MQTRSAEGLSGKSTSLLTWLLRLPCTHGPPATSTAHLRTSRHTYQRRRYRGPAPAAHGGPGVRGPPARRPGPVREYADRRRHGPRGPPGARYRRWRAVRTGQLGARRQCLRAHGLRGTSTSAASATTPGGRSVNTAPGNPPRQVSLHAGSRPADRSVRTTAGVRRAAGSDLTGPWDEAVPGVPGTGRWRGPSGAAVATRPVPCPSPWAPGRTGYQQPAVATGLVRARTGVPEASRAASTAVGQAAGRAAPGSSGAPPGRADPTCGRGGSAAGRVSTRSGVTVMTSRRKYQSVSRRSGRAGRATRPSWPRVTNSPVR